MIKKEIPSQTLCELIGLEWVKNSIYRERNQPIFVSHIPLKYSFTVMCFTVYHLFVLDC